VNNSEDFEISYSKEFGKILANFGTNGRIGPKIPVNNDEDCCSHGNHTMSGCADCDIDALDYIAADTIVCDSLGLHDDLGFLDNPKADYSLVWGGRWIVILIDKGDDDPYLVCLKRDSDGKWYRGAMKSIEDSLG